MIVFDLQCDQEHSFEGWFEDLKDLQRQIKKGLVSCPVCGSAQVRRVPSSFGIAKASSSIDQEKAAQLLGQSLKRYFVENFEDVGPQFAKEALKIHYGASEARNIRGVSTAEEEKVLKEEGVEFFKVGPEEPAPADSGEEED
ncbi:MAG: DUF1178 family protein [Desulfarculaceae bacterium]|nr:DUF1178 family protein [Desulfarculaceae bacterium]MCF8046401.1 DUF1178 family protein [Desulfarculaceae bacterium]MCF8064261.1 DUF1178 family protein [Desulfarculaceae bacterium]MCF8097757.1 DUF1178 family protein [Desulfarculaceae bacterium]MCF8123163.1 DUF1178 family protein [Desulfarculaceae bacterium]